MMLLSACHLQAQPDKHDTWLKLAQATWFPDISISTATQLMTAGMGVQGTRRLLPGVVAFAFAVIGTPLLHPVPHSAHQLLCGSLLAKLRSTRAGMLCGFLAVLPGQHEQQSVKAFEAAQAWRARLPQSSLR